MIALTLIYGKANNIGVRHISGRGQCSYWQHKHIGYIVRNLYVAAKWQGKVVLDIYKDSEKYGQYNHPYFQVNLFR